MNNFFKNTLLWIVIAIVMLSFFQSFSPNSMRQQTLDYSTFLELVRTGNVSEVVFENEIIRAKRINGDRFVTYNPETDNTALIGELNRSGVNISASPQKEQNLFVSLLINSFPVILLIGVWIYFMRQMQGGIGGGRGAMSFGKSKAKLLGEDQVNVTFADVAGIEEAKEEVQAAAALSSAPYNLLGLNKECNGRESRLKPIEETKTLEGGATRCALTDGCEYFDFGAEGTQFEGFCYFEENDCENEIITLMIESLNCLRIKNFFCFSKSILFFRDKRTK